MEHEVVKGELPIHNDYQIVKLANNEGMFMLQDINGKKQVVEDVKYKGLYVPQMLIKGRWFFISEGLDINKKPFPPKAFPTIKLCEEYILDFHSRYARKVKETNRNL